MAATFRVTQLCKRRGLRLLTSTGILLTITRRLKELFNVRVGAIIQVDTVKGPPSCIDVLAHALGIIIATKKQ